MSESAALSCTTDDGAELLEVVCVSTNESRPLGANDLANVVADGVVKQISAFRSGRVLRREDIGRWPLGRSLRILAEHEDNGRPVTSEYYITASERAGLYVALKCLSSRFAASRPDFTKACATLRTPWTDIPGHTAKS